MTFKTIDDVKRFVKQMDVKPTQDNIRVLGICEECGLPGLALDPFVKHAEGCKNGNR